MVVLVGYQPTLAQLFHSTYVLAPDYNADRWRSDKHTLGLDFPNVRAFN